MNDVTCMINWCNKPPRAVGLCGMHHQRRARGQDMNAPPRAIHGVERPWCAVPGCSVRADSALPESVCAKHRLRMSRTGSRTISRIEGRRIPTCTVFGCERPYKGGGLCNSHYVRARKYGLSALQMDMLVRIAKCECCGKTLDHLTMQIDHDHSCCSGQESCGECVRGVLCVGCNVGLGAFSDSPVRLQRAAAYLVR